MLAGAGVAVLGAALLGGAGLRGTDAPTGNQVTSTVAGHQVTSTVDQTMVAAAPVSVQEPASERHTPPWQDSPPPLPEGGMEPENPDLPNAWEIPDARPTGVDYLDQFGAPRQGMNYPRLVPVFGVMACNTGAQDIEPEAGQSWMYYLDDSSSGTVDISITGWADSTAARDALREDTMTFCVRDTTDGWEQVEWAERAGDEDYLRYRAHTATGLASGFAIVRQGDYLVGVTVTAPASEDATEVAAEIAARTADNLEALDVEHGRD